MDSKTYNKDLRKTCVEAVFDEFTEHGDMIRPQYAEQWDEIDANRSFGHITGPMDIDVPDLVDVIIDTIGREPSDRGLVGADLHDTDLHAAEPLELLTDETGIIAANQR